ncbi:MAG: YdcF family protein [Ruminiclostridium sp.]|nr:YdcF family protein [Ruminiclostridium sp.]
MKKKKIRFFIFLFIGLAGVLDTIMVRAYVQGMDLGTLMPAVIGVIFIIFAFKPYWEKYLEKVNPFLRKAVYWGFLLFLLIFVVVEGCIILGGIYTPILEEQPEYVIVLGAGIKEDGSPTLSLVNRLELSIAYAAQYPGTTIIVSGGQGSNEPMPEAQAMAQYLKSRGVDAGRIMIEDKSTSTMENFKYSKELIGEQKEIAFITSDFHIFRSSILTRRNGLKGYGYATPTPGIVLVNCYIREFFALFKSLVFDF